MKSFQDFKIELSEKYQVYVDAGNRRWALSHAGNVSKAQQRGHKLAAVCGNQKMDWTLVTLDNWDKGFTKKVKLKSGEMLFRAVLRISDQLPLVKVNISKGLIYFLTDRVNSGEVDEPEFEGRGVKLTYLRLDPDVVDTNKAGIGSNYEYTKEETVSESSGNLSVSINDISPTGVATKDAKKIKALMAKGKSFDDAFANVTKTRTKKGAHKIGVINALKKMGVKNVKHVSESLNNENQGEKGDLDKKVKQHNISVKYGRKGTLTRPPKGYVKNNKGMYIKVSDDEWRKTRLKESVSVRFRPKTGVHDQMFNAISGESEFKKLTKKTEKDGVYVVTGDKTLLRKMAFKLKAKGYINEGAILDEKLSDSEKKTAKSLMRLDR